MTPLEKIQFIEAHAVYGQKSLCHLTNWFEQDLFSSVTVSPLLKINKSSYKELIINSCEYLYCNFDMLRGSRYNQIFLNRKVDRPQVYLSLLKYEKGDFIYCFEREEYVWDSLALEA